MPLDETIDPGQIGHISDHEVIADVVNSAARVDTVNTFALDQKIADGAKLLLGTAGDTNLYRSAANILRTDDTLLLGPQATNVASLETRGFGESTGATSDNYTIKIADASGDTMGYIGYKGVSWNVSGLYNNAGTIYLGWGVGSLFLNAPITEFANPIRLNPRGDVAQGVLITSSGNIPTVDIRRHSGQSSADLQRWMHENASTILASMSRDGGLTLNGTTFAHGAVSWTVGVAPTRWGTSAILALGGIWPSNGNGVGDIGVSNTGLWGSIYLGGSLNFGAGGIASDVNLYRSAANTLKTDDDFTVARTIIQIEPAINDTGGALRLRSRSAAGALQANFQIFANTAAEQLLMSDGTNTYMTVAAPSAGSTITFAYPLWIGSNQDTNLYRSAANVLATDDQFLIASGRLKSGTAGGWALGANNTWGSLSMVNEAGTTQFQILEAGYLGFSYTPNLTIRFSTASTERLRIGADIDIGVTGKLVWGTAFGTNDTNLYRANANELKTDDNLTVAGTLQGTTQVRGASFTENGVSNGMLFSVSSGNANYGFRLLDRDAASASALFQVRGATTQTHDLQQWQTSTGTILSFVDAAGRYHMPVVATGSLPAAAAAMDGAVIVEDAGAGDRNLIIYAGAQRFRIDGGTAF